MMFYAQSTITVISWRGRDRQTDRQTDRDSDERVSKFVFYAQSTITATVIYPASERAREIQRYRQTDRQTDRLSETVTRE